MTNESGNENETEQGGESGESAENEAEGETRLVAVDMDGGEAEVEPSNGNVVTGPHEGDPVPYHRIVPDTSKGYENLNAYERRAILLERMEKAGHPRAIGSTYSELADEFGVASKSTIHNDFERISEYVAENLSRDHHMILDTVFRKAVEDLADEGKYAWAAEVGKEWYDWLADLGQVERVAEDVNLNVSDQRDETDEYRIIPDDEAEALEVPSKEAAPAETNSNE